MPLEEAMLHVSDLSMQRGYGIFDFFRVLNGKPLFVQDHLDRFFASATATHLPISQSREEIQQIIAKLSSLATTAEAGIRLMLTGGYATDGYTIAEPNLVITCKPAPNATFQDFEEGYSIITYNYQRELPHVKSINYLMALWLQPLLKEKRANDVLYFNSESITEFPRANVFVITKENILVTPIRNMLKGITRKHVLQLAAESMQVEERDIPAEELQGATEIFLTSTTKRILPVVQLNGYAVGNGTPGAITRHLYKAFLAREKQELS